MTAYRVSPFELISVPVPKSGGAAAIAQPTNHVVILDCSGSMSQDLPLIRDQLKSKLPRLLAEGDTISIIWFSGKGEFGTLIKGEAVTGLKDLGDLGKAIDRWLKPVGLTGFKEPLEEAKKLVQELGGVCSLFFMSDGQDNQWSQAQIMKAVTDLGPLVASTVFVEYGYYCNHPLMVSMAESAGGSLILNEDFRRYEPTFEANMAKRPFGAKRIEVEIGRDTLKGFAFALDANALLTFRVEGNHVMVPEHLDEIWFMSTAVESETSKATRIDSNTDRSTLSAVYAAVALYAQRMATDIVFPLLRTLGDVRIIHQWSKCFGKQKYAEFVEATTLACFDPQLHYQQGYDPLAVPDDNAFTILDLLRIVSQDEGNRLLLDSDLFKYNRIGRGHVQDVGLTADELKEVDEIQREMKVAKGKLLENLTTRFASLSRGKAPLKFEALPMPDGVPVGALVYNETRPNVSVQTRREGTLSLKDRKAGGHSKVPDSLPTFIYRNYTIIRDGLVNVDALPLKLTDETVRKMKATGFPGSAVEVVSPGVYLVKLRELPILNRAMVQATSAKKLFELEYGLTLARAGQKVYNTYLKDNFEARVSEGFKVLYGAEEAEWLKEQGVTDYGGFNPGGKQAAARDSYIGKELHVALKGLSSLPSLKDVQGRIASGKHTAPSLLMAPYVQDVEDFLASDIYKGSADQPKLFRTWLEGQVAEKKKTVRTLLYEVSQIRTAIIVGQIWFSEFSSLEEDTLTIQAGGKTIQGTVSMKEVEVPI